MNKIYNDPIERARTISEGISKNASELKSRGFNPESSADDLIELSDKLQKASDKYDDMFEAISKQREECHTLLERLKNTINFTKSEIKSRYTLEQWSRFGLVDKR